MFEEQGNRRGSRYSRWSGWSKNAIILYGIVMGSFGLILVILSFQTTLLLNITSIPYSEIRQPLFLIGLISAIAVGPVVGGFLLAFNTWRENPVVGERRTGAIARIWRGITPGSKADQYVSFLQRTGVKDYRSSKGNRGVYVLRRVIDDKAEFVLISFWESFEAIRRFAGSDVEKAFYYPEDKDFLVELEPKVSHYQVMVAE